MKKILLVSTLAALILLTACEQRKFTQIVAFSFNENYEIAINGETTQSMFFTRADIINQLNLPDKIRVTDAYIESISGTISPSPSNQAAFFHTSGEIIRPNGKRKAWDTESNLIPIPFPVTNPTFNLANSLIQDGIEDLADQILDVLADPTNPSTISIDITIKPSDNQLLVIDANFQITATIEYEFCQDVPPFSDGGEECDF